MSEYAVKVLDKESGKITFLVLHMYSHEQVREYVKKAYDGVSILGIYLKVE